MSLAERSVAALPSPSEEVEGSVGLKRVSGFEVENLWGGEEVDSMGKV